MKRIGLVVSVLIFTLLLSACVELKGDLGVNSAARLSGEITYKINKSLASAAGFTSLEDVNRESNNSSTQQDGLCDNLKGTENATDYIFKCTLNNSIFETGDIVAQLIGKNVYFRFKSNLDASSSDSSRIDFGSISLTLRFADAVTSYKENKVGLVRKIDNFTYRISGYATEPMDIEIIANCGSRCGVSNSVPIPVPTQTISPQDIVSIADAAAAATDAANAATDAANAAAEAVDSETSDFFDLLDSAVAKATSGVKTVLDIQKVLKDTEERLIRFESRKLVAESESAKMLKLSSDKSLPLQAQKLYTSAYNNWTSAIRAIKRSLDEVTIRLEMIKNSQNRINKVADEYLARQSVVSIPAVPIKKTTVTCIKGKLTTKVTSVKPVCPSGYKKK